MDQVELAAYALERLGVRGGDLEALQTLRLDRIIDVAVDISDRFGKMVFDGAVDGIALPAHPVEMLRSGAAAQVPLMIGTTANEFRGGIPEALAISDEGLVDMLSNVIGRRDTGCGAREPLARYRLDFPEMSNARAFGEIFTDYAHANAIAVAEAKHAGGGTPVYTYLYTAGQARHCDELPYLFRWGQDGNLADIMSDTWLTFARTGNPNHDGIPHWQPYSPDHRSTMILDETPRTETDPLRHARLRWDELSAANNQDRTG
jgi:para-nitrobenzyl esterase